MCQSYCQQSRCQITSVTGAKHNFTGSFEFHREKPEPIISHVLSALYKCFHWMLNAKLPSSTRWNSFNTGAKSTFPLHRHSLGTNWRNWKARHSSLNVRSRLLPSLAQSSSRPLTTATYPFHGRSPRLLHTRGKSPAWFCNGCLHQAMKLRKIHSAPCTQGGEEVKIIKTWVLDPFYLPLKDHQ